MILISSPAFAEAFPLFTFLIFRKTISNCYRMRLSKPWYFLWNNAEKLLSDKNTNKVKNNLKQCEALENMPWFIFFNLWKLFNQIYKEIEWTTFWRGGAGRFLLCKAWSGTTRFRIWENDLILLEFFEQKPRVLSFWKSSNFFFEFSKFFFSKNLAKYKIRELSRL